MKRILIVGGGGIGERHLRCFMRTGRTEVSLCETNPARREAVRTKYGVAAFPDLMAALKEEAFDGVVICTPADSHIELALAAIQTNAALLLEKPLSISLDKIDLLETEARARQVLVRVAYVNRARPGCKEVRDLLRSGELGPVLQASINTGQHFPHFRPDYRSIYYARRESGGGAIQDALTHMANLVEWFVGPTSRVYCEAAHQFLEGVEIEDTASVVARNGEALINYALNQFQAPNETLLFFHCSQGSVRMEFHEQRWAVYRLSAPQWEQRAAPFRERDDMFVAQANDFLNEMEGKPSTLCTLGEAIQTLRFNLGALESARTGQAVSIGA